MKFGLHKILANQSIAQLSRGLQIASGNAQTIISFRISRSDAEVLARVLGKVDPNFIKRIERKGRFRIIFNNQIMQLDL